MTKRINPAQLVAGLADPVSIPHIVSGQHALVFELPNCDLHAAIGMLKQARYDAVWPMAKTWAYLCQSCFDEAGCTLGVGRGQMLVLPDEVQNMVSPPDVPPGCDPQEYMNFEWEVDHR